MAAPPDAKPRLGINLAGPADWATELPFVDVFRTSRPWISQRKGAGWGQGPELAIDEFGWVKQLQPGCYAESMLCTISDGHYPSGIYTVIYEGDGEIQFGKGPTHCRRDAGTHPNRGRLLARRILTANQENEPARPRPQHPRHYARIRRHLAAGSVSSRVPETLARHGLFSFHGLDAYQRV